MLPGPGLGDDAGLAHAHRQQDLPDAIVDLVRAGVVELIALEPHLRAHSTRRTVAQRFGQPFGIIEWAGATDIVLEQVVELRLECRIGLCRAVFAVQFEHQRH